MNRWIKWCRTVFPTVTVQQRLVLLGDNIKIPKEALHQPGIVKLHQESGNSGKLERFWGSPFWVGGVLLAGSDEKFFVVPCFSIHEGVNPFRQLQEPSSKGV